MNPKKPNTQLPLTGVKYFAHIAAILRMLEYAADQCVMIDHAAHNGNDVGAQCYEAIEHAMDKVAESFGHLFWLADRRGLSDEHYEGLTHLFVKDPSPEALAKIIAIVDQDKARMKAAKKAEEASAK